MSFLYFITHSRQEQNLASKIAPRRQTLARLVTVLYQQTVCAKSQKLQDLKHIFQKIKVRKVQKIVYCFQRQVAFRLDIAQGSLIILQILLVVVCSTCLAFILVDFIYSFMRLEKSDILSCDVLKFQTSDFCGLLRIYGLCRKVYIIYHNLST